MPERAERIGPCDILIIYDADDRVATDPSRKNDNYPDPGDNHGAAGGNMVFCDGHAQWVAQKNYMTTFILGTDEYHPPINIDVMGVLGMNCRMSQTAGTVVTAFP